MIAEPILEVHRRQSICDKHILLLDVLFLVFFLLLIPKIEHVYRENLADIVFLFFKPPFQRDERNGGLLLTWQSTKRLCMSVEILLVSPARH